ncbi:MAG: SBBP repeat-containing protein [Bacteroidota bacterium]|nr:SBBP repeat-containing protein [Bacteroidota bacterium]
MNSNIQNIKILRAVFLFVLIILSQNAFSQVKQDWVSRFNGVDGEDKANAMTIDNEGNIYLAGYSEGKGTGKDFMTIKYSEKGEIIWSQRFIGIGFAIESEDEARAIVTDGKGNVYVTGHTSMGRAGIEFCTIKYNAKGQEEWINYFSGLGNIEDSYDEATSIATDGNGSIYVTGNSIGDNGSDICILKYDESGNQVWASLFDGKANGNDYAVSVKADKQGFVYVAGTTEGGNTSKDYFVAKYSKSGEQEWVQTYNGIDRNLLINDDEVSALEVDESGNVYVTGYSYGGITGKDFLTIKYNSSGQIVWVSRIDNSQMPISLLFDDEAKALAVNSSGDVYVTGKTSNSQSGSDYFTVKIGLKGQKLWAKLFNSETIDPSLDGAEALVLDSKGNIYVTGYINDEQPFSDCGNERGIDFCTIKYTTSGEQKWIKDFNGSGGIGNNDDIAKGILINGSGNLYVMGESMGSEETKLDFCLVKYSEDFPTSIIDSNIKQSFELYDNFPNPFNPSTKISFNVSVVSNVKLTIYDISGREVSLLENSILQPGKYQYQWNASQFASGTYFYKIQASDFVMTKKMTLIK